MTRWGGSNSSHVSNFGLLLYVVFIMPPQETLFEMIGRMTVVYVSLVVCTVLLLKLYSHLRYLWKYRDHWKYERSLRWRQLARNKYTVLEFENQRDEKANRNRWYSGRD